MHPYLRSFRPTQPALPALGRARIFIGALLGILLTTLVSRWWLGGNAAGLPYLVAPIGASSVLVFAAPATPLAQPWAVFGGNVVSGLAGVLCARLIPDPVLAGACAVALAILGMSCLRCLHPPGGAVALTAVLGGPAIQAAGFGFVAAPVAANTLLLIAMGLAFNNLTRHRYPHVAPAQPQVARNSAGYTIEDLDQVLAHYGEQLDVDRDDLDAVFRQVEARAYQRRHGDIRCGAIRSRVPAAVGPEDTVATVRGLMADYHMRSVPVTDEDGRLLGVIPPLPATVPGRQGIRHLVQPAVTALATTPVVNILPAMTAGAHEAMVVDEVGRLVGMVTTADLLSALYGNEAIALAG